MNAVTIHYAATGTIQTHRVKTAGTYLIEAAGGQGGPGTGGARVSGMFYLKAGDRLKLVAGRRGTATGRGGDSLIWTGTADLPQPVKLMLSARGGKGMTERAGDDAGSLAGGIRFNNGEADQPTADTLATQWTRVADPSKASPAARADHCGYNAGSFRTSTPDAQTGDGYVSISPVAVPDQPARPAPTPVPAENPTKDAPPSQTVLPQVTPRPASWNKLLRKRRPGPEQ